jgi:hypothetical protein
VGQPNRALLRTLALRRCAPSPARHNADVSAVHAYPTISGPLRSYIVPLAAALIVGAAVHAATGGTCRACRRNAESSALLLDTRDISTSGSGRHFRQGSCSCLQ